MGDELFANSLSASLRKIHGIQSVEIYAPNNPPSSECCDCMIYLNDTLPNKDWAKHHILYLQNGFGAEAEDILSRLLSVKWDGFVFFSKKLLSIHESSGGRGLFLPFGVDTSFFYPRPTHEEFEFEVAYVGNDIKGKSASTRYLLPAADFNFGLYGNWKRPHAKFRRWKNFDLFNPTYRVVFERLSKGRIPQEDVPILYSSAKINLNCTIESCIEWDVITLRTLEVLACGGFLITDEVPSARKLMSDCMVFTTGGKDLSDKIGYFLAHPEERSKISQNGYRYVTTHGSIDARALELHNFLKTTLTSPTLPKETLL